MSISLAKYRTVQPFIHQKGPLLLNYITRTLPAVQRQLKEWRRHAEQIPDDTLRGQALSSLTGKSFHCQGGAVFAAIPRNDQLLSFIVAYQTLCDYLDNLCDRTGTVNGEAFYGLHQSLLDALDNNRPISDYYKRYPCGDDGGYITRLVQVCRQSLQGAEGLASVEGQARQLVEWYCALQVAKHLDPRIREDKLYGWAAAHLDSYPDLYWQEFAAACGSTLALFMLMREAFSSPGDQEACEVLLQSYFPWICGLHILLDYWIDQQEDRRGGDLNFTFYYTGQEEMINRISYLLKTCYRCCKSLPEKEFHEMVIHGLLAMYLSDQKIEQQGYGNLRRALLNQGGPETWSTYRICRAVRRFL